MCYWDKGNLKQWWDTIAYFFWNGSIVELRLQNIIKDVKFIVAWIYFWRMHNAI